MSQDKLMLDYQELIDKVVRHVAQLKHLNKTLESENERLRLLLDNNGIDHEIDADTVPFEDFEEVATEKLNLTKNWHTAVQTQLGLPHGTITVWKKKGEVPRTEYHRAFDLTATKKTRRKSLDAVHKERLCFLLTQKMSRQAIADSFNAEFPDVFMTKNDVINFNHRDSSMKKATA